MSLDKTKLLISFAIGGFLLGSVAYTFFSWLFATTLIWPFPILATILSPWFLSGIAGSLLVVTIVYFAARFAHPD